jgi:hypothetical protein
MVKHMEKDQDMFFVSTLLSGANILDDHVSDSLQAMLFMRKIGGQCGSSDLREMLMFRDGEHFLFGQAAKGYAVLKGDHERIHSMRPHNRRSVTTTGAPLGEVESGDDRRVERLGRTADTTVGDQLIFKHLIVDFDSNKMRK